MARFLRGDGYNNKMTIVDVKKSNLFMKVIALLVAGAFFANTFSYAESNLIPDNKLAAVSRFKTFFENTREELKYRATVTYLIKEISRMVKEDELRESHIVRLNQYFRESMVDVNPEIEKGVLSSAITYAGITFYLGQEKKPIKVYFIKDHKDLAEDEFLALRTKNANGGNFFKFPENYDDQGIWLVVPEQKGMVPRSVEPVYGEETNIKEGGTRYTYRIKPGVFKKNGRKKPKRQELLSFIRERKRNPGNIQEKTLRKVKTKVIAIEASVGVLKYVGIVPAITGICGGLPVLGTILGSLIFCSSGILRLGVLIWHKFRDPDFSVPPSLYVMTVLPFTIGFMYTLAFLSFPNYNIRDLMAMRNIMYKVEASLYRSALKEEDGVDFQVLLDNLDFMASDILSYQRKHFGGISTKYRKFLRIRSAKWTTKKELAIFKHLSKGKRFLFVDNELLLSKVAKLLSARYSPAMLKRIYYFDAKAFVEDMKKADENGVKKDDFIHGKTYIRHMFSEEGKILPQEINPGMEEIEMRVLRVLYDKDQRRVSGQEILNELKGKIAEKDLLKAIQQLWEEGIIDRVDLNEKEKKAYSPKKLSDMGTGQEPGDMVSESSQHFGDKETAQGPTESSGLLRIIEETEKIHSENRGFTPAIPEKTILCHIITDSILPEEQRNMLKVEVEQYLGKSKNGRYSEMIFSLSDPRSEDPEEFMAELEKVKARVRARLPGHNIDFTVACPSNELVYNVQKRGMRALAFSREEGHIVQVEGIMLALRALYMGNVDKLIQVYRILTGKEMSDRPNNIEEFARAVIFILPARKVGIDDIKYINDLIASKIQSAA